MILTAKALLDKNPRPIRSAKFARVLAGNLCRCAAITASCARSCVRRRRWRHERKEPQPPRICSRRGRHRGRVQHCAVAYFRPSGAAAPGTLAANRRLDSWLRIDPLGTVTVYSGRVELGQGNVTALAQIVAEELDIALERVRMIPADTTRSPNEGVTAGSNSIEAGGAALRAAAAEARSIVLAKAAEHLSAPPDKLSVKDGTVTVAGGQGSISYWELAAETSLQREATGSAAPKPASGAYARRNTGATSRYPDKVMAEPAFVQDLRLPGMVFGRVVRPRATARN